MEDTLKRPQDYVGNRPAVRRIFSRIGAARPQSVAVIGGMKTGKTSLLNFLCFEEVKREYLPDPERYRLLRISLPTEDKPKAGDLIASIRKAMDVGIGDDYEGLRSYVERSHENGERLIMLFDDFNRVTGSDEVKLEFFSFMRSLANNYNLAFVTTSYLELQKLCVMKDIEESPFFNIFTNISLSMLRESEGKELLRMLGIENEQNEEILSWCGPFPFHLKQAAAFVKDNPSTPWTSIRDRELLPLQNDFFAKVVSILETQALSPLSTIAKGKTVSEKDLHLVLPLVKQGFLIEENDILKPFSKAFEEFLLKIVTKSMLGKK